MVRLLGLGLVMLATGCGGVDPVTVTMTAESGDGVAGAASPSDETTICESGRTVECPCPNGGKGAQTCSDDGSKWGSCQCADVKPPVPTMTPSQGCRTRYTGRLIPEQACPAKLPAVYLSCPMEFIASGLCSYNNAMQEFTCCPEG